MVRRVEQCGQSKIAAMMPAKQLAKSAHPDTGGSDEQFKALNAAYERAVKYFEGRQKG